MLVECVVNVSEGRDASRLGVLDEAAGPVWRDRHSDPDHHRSVFTLVGDAAAVGDAVRALATATVDLLDLAEHRGAHPRLGVLDVVPFVPFETDRPAPKDLRAVIALRDGFAHWLATELAVPVFLYGPLAGGETRTLPDVRRAAFKELPPDMGPEVPHPTAGACAVGARSVLVAYNVWVSSLGVAQQVAPVVRGPGVRALALAVGDGAQVSCNLIEPDAFAPDRLYDAVKEEVERAGAQVVGAELVGLIPRAVLARIPAARWAELDLSEEQTIEARLEREI